MYVCMYVCMYTVTLGSARACGGKYEMAELKRDDSKRRHSFCQIGIAHGVGHSYSYGYRLVSGTWAKAKAGAQFIIQVSIWDMGQGQSWGTVIG